MCLGKQAEQLAVVDQHFFKVRNVPLRIDAVAVETPADVVAQATVDHSRQGKQRMLGQPTVTGLRT